MKVYLDNIVLVDMEAVKCFVEDFTGMFGATYYYSDAHMNELLVAKDGTYFKDVVMRPKIDIDKLKHLPTTEDIQMRQETQEWFNGGRDRYIDRILILPIQKF